MRALSKLFGLAAAVAAAAIYVTGCDANGNLDQNFVASQQAVMLDSCEEGAPGCTPTGAHTKHAFTPCATCHAVAGRVVFSKTGPAYAPGLTPTFSAGSKTCSNVACHSVPAGTFSYYFPGGDGEPELRTVSYGGTAGNGPTPSWNAPAGTGGCTSCHGIPPSNYSWHGAHGGGNGCNLCHRDALNDGSGLVPLYAAEHANGTVNVSARFTSGCFGCH